LANGERRTANCESVCRDVSSRVRPGLGCRSYSLWQAIKHRGLSLPSTILRFLLSHLVLYKSEWPRISLLRIPQARQHFAAHSARCASSALPQPTDRSAAAYSVRCYVNLKLRKRRPAACLHGVCRPWQRYVTCREVAFHARWPWGRLSLKNT
jgi:hypothetical protein